MTTKSQLEARNAELVRIADLMKGHRDELAEALRYYASDEAKAHGYDNGALARAALRKAGI